ncbi:MAG: hypothetical protein HWE39_09420 [Oceanospirillaceae bacterium]|nr:hypothetical protein [Oceanospirillaceae bacterium]
MITQADIALNPGMPPELVGQLQSLGRVAVAERRIAPGTRIYACMAETAVDARLIDRLPPSVELIAIAGADTGRVDLEAARARGIKVSHTPAAAASMALSLKANIAAFLDRGLPLNRI